MTISWESTYEQFKAGVRARIWASPETSLRFAFNFIFIPILGVIGLSVLLVDIYVGRKIGVAELMIAFALAGWAIGNWVSRPRRLRKLFENAWPPNVTERRTTLIFSEEGVYVECPGVGKSQLEWNAFSRFVPSRKVILIYLSKAPAVIIPREILTKDQDAELIQLLETKVGR